MLGRPLVRPAGARARARRRHRVRLRRPACSIIIAGKLTLGRSFGLMPANRGVVSSGIYRFVRHPIYAGYLITHVAFLAAHPTPLEPAACWS